VAADPRRIRLHYAGEHAGVNHALEISFVARGFAIRRPPRYPMSVRGGTGRGPLKLLKAGNGGTD
jgi:hypothetical protein